MPTINIHEAKTHLSKLVEEVAQGGEVIISRAGKPAARLVPLDAEKPIRKPGALKGKLRIAADFDAPLPANVQAAFEGR